MYKFLDIFEIWIFLKKNERLQEIVKSCFFYFFKKKIPLDEKKPRTNHAREIEEKLMKAKLPWE